MNNFKLLFFSLPTFDASLLKKNKIKNQWTKNVWSKDKNCLFQCATYFILEIFDKN